MTKQQLNALDRRLTQFLQHMTASMSRQEQKTWAGFYLKGLLLDGERKSVEPMAKRVGADVQSLQQFIGQSPWSAEAVQTALNQYVHGPARPGGYWIVDETGFPKQGEHSVGVARQYCGTLGKKANCQLSVSLHWSHPPQSWPLGWRLYLPESWIQDRARRRRAGIPKEVRYQTKPQLALDLIESALAQQLPPAVVVADSAYGNSFAWRARLHELRLSYCVEVEGTTTVWTKEVWRASQSNEERPGRPRRWPLRRQSISLETLARQLPTSAWQTVKWREGSRGPQRSRFALVPVRAAHRHGQMGKVERWVEYALIQWPKGEADPVKYWLSWWRDQTPKLLTVVPAAKARWRVEQDYRELKDELGLDHFEGRSWLGWYHHGVMVTLAFVFLRLEQRHYKKKPTG